MVMNTFTLDVSYEQALQDFAAAIAQGKISVAEQYLRDAFVALYDDIQDDVTWYECDHYAQNQVVTFREAIAPKTYFLYEHPDHIDLFCYNCGVPLPETDWHVEYEICEACFENGE